MGMKARLMARQLSNSGAAEKLTQILASLEREQLEAAQEMEDAHEINHIGTLPDVEDRQEALMELLQAVVTGEFGEFWDENVLPSLVDEPERAASYRDMDTDAWEEQMGRWADTYRNQGATGSDRDLAEFHVRETFGSELEEFEAQIVDWNPGAEVEQLFAGNFRAVRDSMYKTAEIAGGDDE